MNTKRALCVGINYTGTSNQLEGCVNDANAWAKLLSSRGFKVTTLLDTAATKSAMTESLRSFVDLTGYRDTFVFTYSGHGTWVPDSNGDEADGRDEAIVPSDFSRAGIILDDELFAIWQRRRFGARLVNVSDSCFSGTVQRALGGASGGRSPGLVRFLPPSEFLPPAALQRAYQVESSTVRSLPRTSALLMSGAKDDEYSYDETSTYPPMGAFTRRALDYFKDGDTYQSWHTRVRKVLPTADLPQSPQLQGTYTQRHWKAL